MEREQAPSPPKLVDIAARDYPEAERVLVSFPDQWEHIETLQTEGQPLYVAGFPIERAFNGREHFEGLPPEINVNLVLYRLYKFFQPWPMPQVTVEWDAGQRRGRVTDSQGWRVRMQPIGQAQAWFGLTHAVVWECFLEESRLEENDPARLASLWRIIEKDVGAPKLLTLPHEPAFHGDYPAFLKELGYQPDATTQGWWSKDLTTEENAKSTKRTQLIESK